MPEIDRISEFSSDDSKWSVSKLQTILDCGYRYYCDYKLKLEKVRSAPLQFGEAIHICLDKIHKQNLEHDSEIQKLWLNTWNEYSKGINWDEELVTRLVYKNRGIKIMEQYTDSKQLRTIDSEIRFETDNYRGMIDRIIELDAGELAVIDFKTGKYPPDWLELRRNYQLTGYRLGAKSLGLDINLYGIYHLVSGEIYWTYRDDRDIDDLYKIIQEAQSKIDNEMFGKNIGHNCHSCPFKKSCLGLDNVSFQITTREFPLAD